MSVYNRKMFKRNARNALNASAGIKAPVQKFRNGGSITVGGNNYMVGDSGDVYLRTSDTTVRPVVDKGVASQVLARFRSPALHARMNVVEGGVTAPMTQLMKGTQIQMTPDSLSGIAGALKPTPQSEQSRFPVYSQPNRGLSSLVHSDTPPVTQGGALMQDIGTGVLNTMDMIGAGGADIVSGIVSPFTSDELNPAFVDQVVKGKATLPADTVQQINAGEIKVPPTLAEALLSGKISASGLDLAKLEGFYQDQEVADVSQIMRSAPGSQTIAVQKTIDRRGPDGQYDGDDLGNAPSTTPPVTDTSGEDPTGGAPSGAGDDGSDTAGDTTVTTTETTTTETEITPKEEIDRVINQGTQEEKEKTLDGFIKEFMDKAPGYEGADSGLILAKIGFAMAAGKSPRAIENIATAMSDGADMLIKDKAKRDEFNRQLNLSALQYGLGEVGKLRAEDRLEQRERRGVKEMVVGAGGTTYKGKQYKENESIFIDVGDIRDGNMPENITSTATLTALGNQAKAASALLKQQLETKQISMTEYQKQLDQYNDAVTTAITSEIGIGLLEGAMINTAEGKVTGVTPAIKSMLNEGANFFGMDLGKEYETLDDVRNAMRASLQDLVPVTLGAAQSANSISNRDVDFLIEAYFGAGALNGGRLAFVTQDEDQMIKRLQRAAGKMRDAQKGAFSTMNTVTNTLSPVFQPGTQQSAALGLTEQAQRLAQAGLSTSGTATFTQLGLTPAGTDSATGLPRFKIG